MLLSDLGAILPELWFAVVGMTMLMLGVFLPIKNPARIIAWVAIAAFVVAGFLVHLQTGAGPAFGGLVMVDVFGDFMKTLVLIGAGFTLIMSLGFIRREGMERFEFPVLIVFATLGMFIMISANDLLSLYVGLEMQSLALYVCAAFQRDNLRSSEAGLKYFVLGAVASGMLLYGCSLVYGFTGTTSFTTMADVLGHGEEIGVGVIVGLVFIAAGLAFKVSAVPFHMWTPDVYEGAPTPVTAFFSVAPKVAAMALLMRVLMGPFGGLFDQWQQIVFLLAVASMFLGAVGAIGQHNIKRLMAYSSIGHVGFALVGLAAGTAEGINGVAIYLAIYVVMGLGTWGCILTMRRGGAMVEDIADLAGLSRSRPQLALCFAIFMFSMAGIPPLAGFFGKFYVFMAAINEGLYTLAVVGVLTSVIGAFYYIRIVKIMYFDEPVDGFDRPIGREVWPVIGLAAIATLLFFVYTGPLLDGSGAASLSLVPAAAESAQAALAQ
ncbi:MAG: NADH-quinone oxidoreductase subunit NuoN [Rhodospirillaceae bacterium]|nr:NADH-quinone oxidoreductase subunit NuoN [Rhodospirillaceae bacterium]MBT6509403.1 NADH-quinone oxidoreductase subunit NuoN [Rhodospirillaceae bacterium]MBT7611673.1 NADH-quinone oxidoreductase subunit NuoN [Rhodospirillaceae bacterium]MBT7646400.1 NADH-quinone oxidoreductase subunit NuoN [Rhodospirillaceae bacterium]